MLDTWHADILLNIFSEHIIRCPVCSGNRFDPQEYVTLPSPSVAPGGTSATIKYATAMCLKCSYTIFFEVDYLESLAS